MRLLCVLFCLLVHSVPVAARDEMPDYLRDLDRPYNSGDWTLQCNSTQLCQILGVVKIPTDGVGVRAVVMINRDIAKDAKPSLRFAFVDSMGSYGVPQPEDGWRLYAKGLPRMPPPIKLSLGPPDIDGIFQTSDVNAGKIISALMRWPGSVVQDKGRLIAKMPKGDLARLFQKMDQLQHPEKPRMTAAETAEWMKEYHYVTLRASLAEVAAPDSLLLSCNTRDYANQPMGTYVSPDHILWSAECPEGYKIFLQTVGKEPVKFDVRDNREVIHPHFYAGMNLETSLLELQLPLKGNQGCGRRLELGFTGKAFVVIKDRRYNRCRGIPDNLWPIVWSPTSWRQVYMPPSNEGNASPVIEGVEAL